MFTYNKRVVSLKIYKQGITAHLMSEDGYIVVSNVSKKIVWLKKFITNLCIIPTILNLIHYLCKNNGVIEKEKETISHQKLKHILRGLYLIREIVDRRDVSMKRVLPIGKMLHIH